MSTGFLNMFLVNTLNSAGVEPKNKRKKHEKVTSPRKCLREWLQLLIHIILPSANLKQLLRIRSLICKFNAEIRKFSIFFQKRSKSVNYKVFDIVLTSQLSKLQTRIRILSGNKRYTVLNTDFTRSVNLLKSLKTVAQNNG